jgi:hypothetical protein
VTVSAAKPPLSTFESVLESDVFAVFVRPPGIDKAHEQRGLAPAEGRRFGIRHVVRHETVGEPKVEIDRLGRGELVGEFGWRSHGFRVRAT